MEAWRDGRKDGLIDIMVSAISFIFRGLTIVLIIVTTAR